MTWLSGEDKNKKSSDMRSVPDLASQKNCHFHQNDQVHNTPKTIALTQTCEIYKVATQETQIRYTNSCT